MQAGAQLPVTHLQQELVCAAGGCRALGGKGCRAYWEFKERDIQSIKKKKGNTGEILELGSV